MTNEEYRIGEDTLLRALAAHRQHAIRSIVISRTTGDSDHKIWKALANVFSSLPNVVEFYDPSDTYNEEAKNDFMPAGLYRNGLGLVEWATPTSNRRIVISGSTVDVNFGVSRNAAGDLACLLRRAGVQFQAYNAGNGDTAMLEDALDSIMRESREYESCANILPPLAVEFVEYPDYSEYMDPKYAEKLLP